MQRQAAEMCHPAYVKVISMGLIFFSVLFSLKGQSREMAEGARHCCCKLENHSSDTQQCRDAELVCQQAGNLAGRNQRREPWGKLARKTHQPNGKLWFQVTASASV